MCDEIHDTDDIDDMDDMRKYFHVHEMKYAMHALPFCAINALLLSAEVSAHETQCAMHALLFWTLFGRDPCS